MSGNFYKGTTKEQTPFFKDKDSQLIAQRKWPAIFDQEVDMSKVNVEVMKAWINHKITELLGFEDDIVISYCLSQLVPEEALAADVDERKNYLCPKKLAISLTGFVGKQATHFVRELWKLLLSAQNTPTGIPPEFLENRRLEMERKREEAARINEELVRRHEQMMATEFNKQIKQFATGTAPPKPPTLVAYDTIPDTGGGMRGWDNDDAPAARGRAAIACPVNCSPLQHRTSAAEVAAARVAEAAALGATGTRGVGAEGAASPGVCRAPPFDHQAEAGTGIVIVGVAGQMIVISLYSDFGRSDGCPVFGQGNKIAGVVE
ncbi:PWI domain-containing protein, putative [Eimeria necatrix]|uniref:PWI domain-containing protein, putative n=1 Tax=Eimeria necatrix TaxID=51315 RepID=U6MIY7_9EIME|nr:PWI domain-containing protein, putative [Eimeria necatrix]CDJ62434.1 PWI domain-containing protein, putative [Eimeria necatrix]